VLIARKSTQSAIYVNKNINYISHLQIIKFVLNIMLEKEVINFEKQPLLVL
jgi:hypothetical protein